MGYSCVLLPSSTGRIALLNIIHIERVQPFREYNSALLVYPWTCANFTTFLYYIHSFPYTQKATPVIIYTPNLRPWNLFYHYGFTYSGYFIYVESHSLL